MKILLKTIVLIFICSVSFAKQTFVQEIDSLEHIIKTQPKLDTNRINLLIDLEYLYVEVSSPKLGQYFPQILELSKQNNYPKGLVFYNILESVVALRKANYSSALVFAQEAHKIAMTVKDPLLLHFCYGQLGQVQLIKVNSNNAGNLAKAIVYFKEMKYWAYKTKDVSRISVAHQNLALALLDDNKNKEALVELNLCLNAIKGQNRYLLEAFLLNLIGRTLIQDNRANEALAPLKEAESLIQKHHYKRVEMPVYFHLGKVYMFQHKLDEAEAYFKKSLDAVAKDNLVKSLEPLEMLSEVNKIKKNYKMALEYSNLYIHIKDSLVTNEKNKAFLELENKYETQQRVQQIEVLKHEQELANTQKKTYLGIASLLVVLLIGAIFAIWQVNKAKHKVDKANNQRDRLFAIVAHDLRAPAAILRRISSKINFVLKKNDPKATDILSRAIEDSATALYTLVDNLLHWSLLQQGKIKISSTVFGLTYEIKEVLQSYLYRANQKKIAIQFDEHSLVEVFADRMLIQTIVRNLLDNAIKFTPENGTIKIEIYKSLNNVELNIVDSGVGISAEIQKVLFDGDATQKNNILGTQGEKGKGIGLYLCKELAIMNSCELKLLKTSEQGTTFSLIIPSR